MLVLLFFTHSDKEWIAGEDGFWYQYYHMESTFAEARGICQRQGGDLAMEKSLITHEYIAKTFRGIIWVGIARKGNTSVFTFVDGSPITKSWWAQGKPDNTADNNCVHHWPLQQNTWHDRDCSFKTRFLCQKSKHFLVVYVER